MLAEKIWPNFKRLTNGQYGFMGLSGHVKYKHVIQAIIDHIKWTGCMIYRMGEMKKDSCYSPYGNIILTRCTIYGMGEKRKGDSRLETIIRIILNLITNPAH